MGAFSLSYKNPSFYELKDEDIASSKTKEGGW